MKYPKEILWEFTLKCNKNCCYCGSKKILNNIKPDDIKYSNEYIANQIIKVHPEEVTITGGEPSCEMQELTKCVKILHEAGIKVKILTNGNLFKELYWRDTIELNYEENFEPYVTCYGYSVNSIEDIKDEPCIVYKDKVTVITNFGTHNIGDFEKIAKYAMQYNCWQVQLTIGNEFQLDLEQIKELEYKLNKIENSGLINIVRADNFICGKCKAGIYGFSITYDGLIVPCLSYRSWKSDMMEQGTVEQIEEIWKNGFKFHRNRKFVPCCKTISGIEKVNSTDKEINENTIDKKYEEKNILDKINPFKNEEKVVFVYGVVNPDSNFNGPMVYGVAEPTINFNNIGDELK